MPIFRRREAAPESVPVADLAVRAGGGAEPRFGFRPASKWRDQSKNAHLVALYGATSLVYWFASRVSELEVDAFVQDVRTRRDAMHDAPSYNVAQVLNAEEVASSLRTPESRLLGRLFARPDDSAVVVWHAEPGFDADSCYRAAIGGTLGFALQGLHGYEGLILEVALSYLAEGELSLDP